MRPLRDLIILIAVFLFAYGTGMLWSRMGWGAERSGQVLPCSAPDCGPNRLPVYFELPPKGCECRLSFRVDPANLDDLVCSESSSVNGFATTHFLNVSASGALVTELVLPEELGVIVVSARGYVL